ncbi:GxxExxY protein [Brumimicrobium glaciale]|uniref:GxxExxY protein n=2 Tax=Brumimicrobium glaciale TaxID=200475 RepID=A0A4Q4KQD3_9FLAO|nr:GxxExxY protein [Brumimicrobium glaciale]
MYLMHKNLTNQIIKTFYDVYNELGHGFLENVYQNALYLELKNRGFYVEAQKQIKVYYKNTQVGVYYADLIIDEVIILELKAAEVIVKEFEFQLLNYLKATEIEVGLLLNFGIKPEFKRKVFTNKRNLESSLE